MSSALRLFFSYYIMSQFPLSSVLLYCRDGLIDAIAYWIGSVLLKLLTKITLTHWAKPNIDQSIYVVFEIGSIELLSLPDISYVFYDYEHAYAHT